MSSLKFLPETPVTGSPSPAESAAKQIPWRSVFLLIIVSLPALFVGCGDSFEKKISEAKRFLQLNEPQKAYELLQPVETPEAYYLKSVALDRLDIQDAALEQIEKALAAEPENVKYRGFRLRLKLYEGNLEDAQELVNLYQENPSSAATSLFAFYGYEAQSVHHRGRKEAKEAKKMREKGLEALRSGIVLCAEIPEFQREMLAFALKFRLPESAKNLMEKLEKVIADDPKFSQQKLAVLLLLGETEEAIPLARQLYEDSNRSEKTALTYAGALQKGDANSRSDQAFKQLAEQYPGNSQIVTSYALYLARSDRLAEAVGVLQEAIDKQKEADQRLKLITKAIALPLESRDAELAEEQITRYGEEISQPLLINYFEGRLLFLKNQHRQALTKLAQIVEAQKKEAGGSRALAAEALFWIDKILADQAVSQELQEAAEAVKQKARTSGVQAPSGSPKKEPESQGTLNNKEN